MNSATPAHNACQRGMTLVEVLVGLAITAVLMRTMTAMLTGATAASSAGAAQLDLQAQAQFVVQRIAAQIGRIPTMPLPDKTDNTTSAPWNLSASYVWDPVAKTLSEITPTTTHVIADSVSSFAITSPPVTAGQTTVAVSVTLTRGVATAAANASLRMGNLL